MIRGTRCLNNLQQPEIQKRLSNLLRFQDVMKQRAAISRFCLPPAVFHAPLSINKNAIRAMVEAADTGHTTQLRSAAKYLARSLNIGLAAEAVASVQYTAMQRFLKTFLPPSG